MERCAERAALSREHHVALEVALRLRRATGLDAETVRDATLGFWHEEGRYFRLEEEFLLSRSPRMSATARARPMVASVPLSR
jgi:hypothetical protein